MLNSYDISQMSSSDYSVKDILSAWLQEEAREIDATTEKAEFLDGCFDILGLICAVLTTIPKSEVTQALRNYQDAQEARARSVDVPHHHAILALIKHVMGLTFTEQASATDLLIRMFKDKALKSFPYLDVNDEIIQYQGQKRTNYFADEGEVMHG